MANHLFDGLMANADRERAFARMPDGRWYTYQHVVDVSGRFANVLVDLGVKPGDRVAVQAPKSIEAMMLYLRRGPRRSCLPAAQHRLYAGGDRVFSRQRHPRSSSAIRSSLTITSR
jgi:non-ribosomal peptide synthetase component E (peptide arylation enzyme)